jgi:predicted ArsR family transcriptional regulator
VVARSQEDDVLTTDATVANHRALAHASRVRVLELVREAPDGTGVTDLAARTGLHPNTVRSHLAQLTGAGLVHGEPVRGGTRGRPAIRYRVSSAGEDDGYRLLAEMLASALTTGDHDGSAPPAEAAGRRWGRRLAGDRRGTSDEAADGTEPAAAVRHLFGELGFAPEPVGEQLVLHACPYRPLARRHPDVVCGVHLGLLRGAVEAHGGDGDAAWLRPFASPTRCTAGLSPTTDDREAPS